MSMKTIGLGVAGLGAVLFAFAVIMWTVNKPDYSQLLRSCGSQPNSAAYKDCERMIGPTVNASISAYNGCLFASRYQACANVMAVPYLSIGGILVLLSGIVLFVVGLMIRPARA